MTDHCSALKEIILKGKVGETYNIGSEDERNNNEVVSIICEVLDDLMPIPKNKNMKSYKELIKYIEDRPGHDKRYAINPKKLKGELNWSQKINFTKGISKTITWYINNQDWVKEIEQKL